MIARASSVTGARVLVLGLTFKENCPDVRNTKVVDVVRELQNSAPRSTSTTRGSTRREAQHEYGLDLSQKSRSRRYDAIVLAVAHKEFRDMGPTASARSVARTHVALRHQARVADGASAGRRHGSEHCVKILVTGAAGFIGFHTRADAARRAATRSSGSTTSTTTTTSR